MRVVSLNTCGVVEILPHTVDITGENTCERQPVPQHSGLSIFLYIYLDRFRCFSLLRKESAKEYDEEEEHLHAADSWRG